MELINSQNSDVAILGNIVVRRPRYAETIAGVRREVKALARLRSLLALPVPQMQIVEVGNDIVTLHPQLPGEPLWSVQTLTDLTQERLAAQIGRFLKSLHQVDSLELRHIELPRIDQQWWTSFLQKAEQLVFPELASTTATALRTQIRSHIEQLPNLACVLRHGDLGSSNILWDGRGKITGIIDFAALGWSDPGWDVAGLSVSYGTPFVMRLASTYPAVESLLEQSLFYRQMFALMDAVFGAEHLDHETFSDGLETLQSIV